MKRTVIIIGGLLAASFGLYFFRLEDSRSMELPAKNVQSSNGQFNAPLENGKPVRTIAEEGASLSTISTETLPLAARTRQSISRERMKQLLLRVDSRATALDYLQGMIDQRSAASFTSADVPRIEIVKEEELTPAQLARFRARDFSEGKRHIALKIDGILAFQTVTLFPIEMIPQSVLVFLTDEDLERFQTAMLVSTIERSAAARRRAESSK